MPSLSREPHIRSAVLGGFEPLAGSLNLSVSELLDGAGLAYECLTDPDRRIPVMAVSRLLESSAILGQCPTIGLRLSTTIHIDRLGLTGLVACGQATVAHAFQAISGFVQLHNEALHLWIEPAGDQLVMREEYMTQSPQPMRQMVEMTAGVLVKNLRTLIGDDWNPLRASFRHAPPAGTNNHRQFFGCPVDFNADVDALLFLRSDFDLPNRLRQSNPQDYLTRARELLGNDVGNPTRRLATNLILGLLPGGNCNAETVAHFLGCDRRTLNRHLAQDGESFKTLVNTVQRELATRHVGLGTRKLGDIALLLGFRSQSDFSHWFRAQFGMAPTQWRKAREVTPQDIRLKSALARRRSPNIVVP